MPNISTKEVKLIVLQWKILHRIYPTNYLLNKMKIKQTNICEHCNMNSIDTIEIFFYDCGKIKVLWKAIESEINLTITEHLAIFGVP